MLQRVHSLAGFPLAVYVLFNLWEIWPAREGRQAWVERMAVIAPQVRTVLVWVVGIALLLHIACSFRLRYREGEALLGSKCLGVLQRTSGLLTLLFVGYHVYNVYLSHGQSEIIVQREYTVLLDRLGHPWELTLYVMGISFIFFHLSHGISRAGVTWGIVRTQTALSRNRYICGALGFVLWGMLLHALGYIAVGHGLWNL